MSKSHVEVLGVLVATKNVFLQYSDNRGRIVVISTLIQPTNQNGQLDVLQLTENDLQSIFQTSAQKKKCSSNLLHSRSHSFIWTVSASKELG